ncbi:MAG: AAA family ATPase [bacterium]
MIELDAAAGTLRWRRLPLLTAAKPVAAPELSEVETHERAQFTVGIDALLRDVFPLPVEPTPTGTPPPFEPAASTPAPEPVKRLIKDNERPANILLYGPPGTGKTHAVRRRALELIGVPTEGMSEPAIQAAWETQRRAGQVVFCTFHQAFAYEEFVEGLRAETVGKEIHYRVEAGIFKSLALRAAAEGLASASENAGATAPLDLETRWSLLVSALQAKPREVRSAEAVYEMEATSTNRIRFIGGSLNAQGKFVRSESARSTAVALDQIKPVWAKRATLGDSPTTYQLKDDVGQWRATAAYVIYRELLKITRVPSAMEYSDPSDHARAALQAGLSFDFSRPCRHFVLVIDEINRANIARVFGELITLLEPDKRLGNSNELRVQLPGSKEWFGVPPNLHVIGTLNTADRSIALMDVALRRRFTFEEMMPDPSIIEDVLGKNGVPAPLCKLVVDLSKQLNERLRYLYDREHQIGHAYFLGVRSLDDLRAVFAERILPLLQEYFFGQWDKVALALGFPFKDDGTPRSLRSEESTEGTMLTVTQLNEKSILGFDHEDYSDRLQWDVHPAFKHRARDVGREWLAAAFFEVAGSKKSAEEIKAFCAALTGESAR